MKYALVLLLALAILTGCPAQNDDGGNAPIKIGVVTGTVSQGEDEVRAAEKLKEMYPGRVIHATYPDNFMQEQDTTIAQIVGLAADPEVKVIVVGQAVPGSIAAVRRVRETREDVLIGFVEPHEDPITVNETADLSLQPDQLSRGRTIAELAKKMGAKTLVHYSFPRHMSMELIAERKRTMEEHCKDLGIEFVFIAAPDPMAEGGLPATQQFMVEDVPRQVKAHGKDTAFFSTNCGMQEPLIKAVLDAKAMYTEPCCPSPTHGFPGSLGIGIPPDKAGDFTFINEQNAKAIAERGMTGRFGTWPVPASYASILAAASILVDSAEGKADHTDLATVKRYLEEAAGTSVELSRYDETKGNYYLMLFEQIVY